MLNPADARPQLLVTVLDWGMGHATRTLPLVEHAVSLRSTVHVASKGTALACFAPPLHAPHLHFHAKPGPDITYSKRGNFVRIASQIPSFLAHIRQERRWAEAFVRTHGVRAVLSDNCYGCAVPGVPSVLVSHQLQLPVPALLEGAARAAVARWAAAFDALWVPDIEPGEGSLSGALADAHVHPHTAYVGVLSRLAPHAVQRSLGDVPKPRTWVKVGMVSGVEPHRSLMEKALRAWMAGTEGPCLVVAGKPGGGVHVDGNVTTWCDPTDTELAHALQEAETVVCRSGYSSQLDLAALGVRAILVPTPGQPEQEFLAQLWAQRFGFTTVRQRDLEAGRLPERATGAVPPTVANAKAFGHLATWLQAALTTSPTASSPPSPTPSQHERT